MKKLGLLGRNIDYSFSRGYFAEKFKTEGISNYRYDNYDLDSLELLPTILQENPALCGLNVTIPYKEAVISYLDDLDPLAQEIGAVNTIKITHKGLTGYNTDIYGFTESLKPLLQPRHEKALILGTGGASKAIETGLKSLGIASQRVSRKASTQTLSYGDLDAQILSEFLLIINCTPLGTAPEIHRAPDIPYSELGNTHLLYDLIYNPEKTTFLKRGLARGAQIKNGLQMLELQAERSWEIWNQPE